MKGNTKVITALNDILTAELTAVNQYFLHARIVENWGFERLWKKLREESIGEMRHADKLIARVLFLEGLPNLQRLGKLHIGESVPEMFKADLEVEHSSVRHLNETIELCRSVGDNGSREVLEGILKDSEEHANWLEAQLDLIAKTGEANYLAQQMKDDE